jgi:hypothetical protein
MGWKIEDDTDSPSSKTYEMNVSEIKSTENCDLTFKALGGH